MAAAVTRPAQSRCPPATWSDVNLHHAEDAEEGRRQSPPPLPTLTTITQRDQPTPERAGTGEPPSPHHRRPFTPSPSPMPARGVPGCHAASARLPRPSTPAKSQLSSPGTTRDPPSAISNQQPPLAAHHSSPAPGEHSVPNFCSACVACVASLSLSIVPRPSRVSGPRPALVRGGGDANTLHPIHLAHPTTQSTPSPNHPINPITQSPSTSTWSPWIDQPAAKSPRLLRIATPSLTSPCVHAIMTAPWQTRRQPSHHRTVQHTASLSMYMPDPTTTGLAGSTQSAVASLRPRHPLHSPGRPENGTHAAARHHSTPYRHLPLPHSARRHRRCSRCSR
jgi:hypothetical protein